MSGCSAMPVTAGKSCFHYARSQQAMRCTSEQVYLFLSQGTVMAAQPSSTINVGKAHHGPTHQLPRSQNNSAD